MTYNPQNPLIIQSDMTMLLEVNSPLYEEVRDAIAPFSEIVKSPEHVHTYRINAISLWNAATSGISSDDVIDKLKRYSRYELSNNVIMDIKGIMDRFGKVRLESTSDKSVLRLVTDDSILLEQFIHTDSIKSLIRERVDPYTCLVDAINRGIIKQALIKAGYPALDIAGYISGASLELSLKDTFTIRPYQSMARDSFYKGGSQLGGSAVVVLPCGAGKTIVGMLAIDLLKTHTLILTTGITAIRQWMRELIDKTTIDPEDIGEYSGEIKQIKPITITTYQILTHRKNKDDDFIHFSKLNNNPWGLIIYDEVHLLPAEVFRFTASLQAIRRLGLTATLVREDGREDDVFSLIGPKCFDVPWKVIEKQGWIAPAECIEVRIKMSGDLRLQYAYAEKRHRYRIAAENPLKLQVIYKLLNKHKDDNILIIGQYIEQLETIAQEIKMPLITGKTSQSEREQLYRDFREGKIKVLIVSSVANFAIDLPDASVAIQVSGKFGSRQEEAQRLGRILRPKPDGRGARFYTLLSKDSSEQDFALKRQLFLTEQGYSYNIVLVDSYNLDDYETCF